MTNVLAFSRKDLIMAVKIFRMQDQPLFPGLESSSMKLISYWIVDISFRQDVAVPEGVVECDGAT